MRRTGASTPPTRSVNFACSPAKRMLTEAIQAASSKQPANLMDIQESTLPLSSPLILSEHTPGQLAIAGVPLLSRSFRNWLISVKHFQQGAASKRQHSGHDSISLLRLFTAEQIMG